MSRWPLAGRVVLITGAASGIGAATAAELHRRGARLALLDRPGTALQAVADGFAEGALALEADVRDAAALDTAVARTLDRFGGIDIAWANAGIASFGPVAATDPDAWVRTIDVNLIGAYRTLRAAVPAVIERRGHLAVTASLASFAHAPGMSAYTASKAGVEALADALRLEVQHHGVSVGAIHPSWIATPMVTDADSGSAPFRRLRATLPPPLSGTLPVQACAQAIADGFERRARRVFIPGWVRAIFWLRALVHTRPLEREMRLAAPEIETLFAADVARLGASVASEGH